MKNIGFLLLIVAFVLSVRIEGASTKQREGSETGKKQTPPPSVPKELSVYSDLEEGFILEILRFIDDATGLECRLVKGGESADGFDIYIGSFFTPPPEAVHHYSSDTWHNMDTSIVRWSSWQSGIAFNDILLGEEREKPESNPKRRYMLTGKISAVDPLKDMYTAAVLFTLYKKYGKQVLVYIDGNIPLYLDNRQELTAALENGRYAGVFTIDGYIIPAIMGQYPIHIDYSALDSDRFPVTSVRGFNRAFISNKTTNPRGSEYFVDFLATGRLRKFVGERFFITPPFSENAPNFLPLALDPGWFETFSEVWKEVTQPEGIDDTLLLELE